MVLEIAIAVILAILGIFGYQAQKSGRDSERLKQAQAGAKETGAFNDSIDRAHSAGNHARGVQPPIRADPNDRANRS